MKIFVCFFLILVVSINIFGQKIFDVQNFSKDYYGKVYIENPIEVFSKGWVEIYQKSNNKRLIKVNSDELISETEDGKIKTNVKELPYGEQSVIIYEDFNFDGIKDFAIMDGQNSCYHGPSFQIFLGGKTKGIFRLNKSFTKLAQDYCGMFDIDPKERKIHTMTKSTCCWHQYSDFIVQNDKPKAIKIIEENYNAPFVYFDIQTLKNGRMITTQEKSLANLEDLNVLLSFKLQNKKEVFLLNANDELSYNLVNEKGYLELSLPLDAGKRKTSFVLYSKENSKTLSFINSNYEYKIYEGNNHEIAIQVNGKNFSKTFLGNNDSKKGSLQNLLSQTLTNLTLKK